MHFSCIRPLFDRALGGRPGLIRAGRCWKPGLRETTATPTGLSWPTAFPLAHGRGDRWLARISPVQVEDAKSLRMEMSPEAGDASADGAVRPGRRPEARRFGLTRKPETFARPQDTVAWAPATEAEARPERPGNARETSGKS